MIRPRKLVDYPWVVVRIECTFCGRAGRYRLARLAARYGPEQDLDGLLRDLAHNCPWWNERARKYEPRCGARFVDLDRDLPPLNHPDAPVHRRKQPAREDIPNPKPQPPSPHQATAVPTLSNWPHAEIVLSCTTCGLRDVLNVALLRQALPGGDERLAYLRYHLTLDCPKRRAPSVYEQCGAMFEQPSA